MGAYADCPIPRDDNRLPYAVSVNKGNDSAETNYMIIHYSHSETWLGAHRTACIIIIIMYIYHALINALSAHANHINLNTIFYTHVEHSPTKTIYIRYCMETHTHTHTHTIAETGY